MEVDVGLARGPVLDQWTLPYAPHDPAPAIGSTIATGADRGTPLVDRGQS
jgi:hypothetical protein